MAVKRFDSELCSSEGAGSPSGLSSIPLSPTHTPQCAGCHPLADDSEAKSGPLPGFVKNSFLGTQPRAFIYVASVAAFVPQGWLSSCNRDRDRMAYKERDVKCPALGGRSMPTGGCSYRVWGKVGTWE